MQLAWFCIDEQRPQRGWFPQRRLARSPQVQGRGPCVLGQTLATLLDHLRFLTSEERALVVVLLGSEPADAWADAADQLRALTAAQQATVLVIGIGRAVDPAVLTRLTPGRPLIAPQLTRDYAEHVFAWV